MAAKHIRSMIRPCSVSFHRMRFDFVAHSMHFGSGGVDYGAIVINYTFCSWSQDILLK